jgi:hypothetical protein
MLCQFESDRRDAEEILAEMMDDQVRARARFKEQLDAYHTNPPVPPSEGSDRGGNPTADPAPH